MSLSANGSNPLIKRKRFPVQTSKENPRTSVFRHREVRAPKPPPHTPCRRQSCSLNLLGNQEGLGIPRKPADPERPLCGVWTVEEAVGTAGGRWAPVPSALLRCEPEIALTVSHWEKQSRSPWKGKQREHGSALGGASLPRRTAACVQVHTSQGTKARTWEGIPAPEEP